jgi:hypothetical protein
MSEDVRVLKCRFCEYTANAVIHYKNGKTEQGAKVLAGHARSAHPEQFKMRSRKLSRGNRCPNNSIDARGEDRFIHPAPLDRIFK